MRTAATLAQWLYAGTPPALRPPVRPPGTPGPALAGFGLSAMGPRDGGGEATHPATLRLDTSGRRGRDAVWPRTV